MKCLNPRRITKNLDPIKFPMGLEIPCGQCMQCRIQKREQWVMRIIHESQYWESCIFFTLTYSDEYLPKNNSLVKSDLQKFFKRLRKSTNKKLMYFASGEYGEKEGRPHYHVIMFGLDLLNKDDVELIKNAWTFCDWKMLGKKPFGDVSVTSIRYVVSYLEKSITGKWEDYAYDGIEIPFHVLSKGIGKRFAIENKEKIEKDGFINIQGYRKAIPRYYADITGIDISKAREFAEEKEVDVIYDLTGMRLNRDELYLSGLVDETVKVEEQIKRKQIQNDLNLNARKSVNARKYKRDT